jgi:hypothetical protein
MLFLDIRFFIFAQLGLAKLGNLYRHRLWVGKWFRGTIALT